MSWDINKKVGRPKKSVKPFGSDAQTGERTVFGSNSISDDLEENLSVDFERGWGIVPQESPPTRQDFNAGMFTNSLLASYLFQQGVPEWDGNQAYFINSIVQKDGQLFVSTDGTDGAANIGNDPAEGAKWVVVSGGGGGGSGTNLITNPQASQGVSGWKMTGGVFESQNSDDGVGGKVFKVTMNAADNVLVNDAAYVTNDTASLVNTCSLYYKQTGGASDISAVDVLIESSEDGNVWTELKRETLSDVGLDKWGYYQTQVVFPDIGSQIRFSFVATGATQFEFDNVHLGSIVGATGAFIGEWEEFIPSFANRDNTNISMSAKQRRVGSNMEIVGFIQSGATLAETEDIQMILPYNLTASDYGLFNHNINYLGQWYAYSMMTGEVSVAHGMTRVQRGTNVIVFTVGAADTISFAGPTTDRSLKYSNFVRDGSQLIYNISVPIAEWQGQGTSIAMSESLVESNYFLKFSGSGGAQAIPHSDPTPVNWNFTNEDFDGTTWTCPASGKYNINAAVVINQSACDDTRPYLAINVNDVEMTRNRKGFTNAYYPVLDTNSTISLKKGDKVFISVYVYSSPDGYDISVSNPNAGVTITRVPDYTAGTLPSFGIATESEYGLVKKNKFQRKTLNTNFASDVGSAKQAISDLIFNNLKSGKWYTAKFTASMYLPSNKAISISFFTGSKQLSFLTDYRLTGSATNLYQSRYYEITFKAEAEQCYVGCTTGSNSAADPEAYLLASDSLLRTYMTLEERNDIVETTDFT